MAQSTHGHGRMLAVRFGLTHGPRDVLTLKPLLQLILPGAQKFYECQPHQLVFRMKPAATVAKKSNVSSAHRRHE